MQHTSAAHDERAARLEALIAEVAAFPDPQARATTQELLQTLLDLYGEGLARILDLIAQAGAEGEAGHAGQDLLAALAEDDVVAPLLVLHDLHPVPIEERIRAALDELGPYLTKHGGAVEFAGMRDGVAQVRLAGASQGCSATAGALRETIEEAIYAAAPDLDDLEVVEAVAPKPVTFVPRRKAAVAQSNGAVPETARPGR